MNKSGCIIFLTDCTNNGLHNHIILLPLKHIDKKKQTVKQYKFKIQKYTKYQIYQIFKISSKSEYFRFLTRLGRVPGT